MLFFKINALKSGAYQAAYGLLSSSRKRQESEPQFAAAGQQTLALFDGISSCAVGKVNQNGSTATGIITYTFGDGSRSAPVNYTLVNESGEWEISTGL